MMLVSQNDEITDATAASDFFEKGTLSIKVIDTGVGLAADEDVFINGKSLWISQQIA